ncbi:twin-arginine translocase TatA/TatE family subunit [Microbacterium sp. CFBP9034]|uniref:twin-arginine translocase TatA/TatE family subunit n=1 Tax=Microbacterium sp. CFBP9034 TaxID=3096540 RepID=UPI002A69F6CD|nr:twin-arginine translocase TatA/TatE family subunit [Microbacterium sp. CFBP9034]MDY0908486.1 twin-arginine translocase TatA/TatE family subunit [Microbacterium sp. CFBP9034]
MANLSGWHLLVILAVVLLLFGATRLPALSRSVGQSVRIFRSETKNLKDESETPPTGTDPGASLPGHADLAGAPVVPHASRTGV